MMPTESEANLSQPHTKQPWDISRPVPEKVSVFDYGYVVNGFTIGCTKEELIKEVAARGPALDFVWTPEFPQPVFPERLQFLTTSFKKRAVKDARQAITWGGALVAFGLTLAVIFNDWHLYRNFLAVIGVVVMIEGGWALYRTRNFTIEDAASEASAARFDRWSENKSISGYTFGLCAALVVVGIVQVFYGLDESFEQAGLVKSAVWQGQVWRLATATLMHASFEHFWMNFLGLLALARIIEQTIHRAFVPVIFYLSAICGSLFSLVLYPHATSVGASGGVMGLIGFLTVAALINREKYPQKYLRRLIEGIIFVGVLGIVGFAMIDNGAHLGGLLCGVGLGWLFLKWRGVETRESGLAILSLLLLGVTASMAIWRIVG